MAANFIAKAEITVDAPASKVWEALTDPKLIKEYMFGTDAKSDWTVGSPVTFKGEFQGKKYFDKGEVLQNKHEKLLQYTHFSTTSGLEDKPENYQSVSFELNEENGRTSVTVKQENTADEKSREHSEENWNVALQGLKKLVEEEHQHV